jgi:hypothetical protein
MRNLARALENATRIHQARTAAYEIREDFPLLRLNKSVRAYQIIAAFQSIPVKQRMEAALAFAAAAGDAAETKHQQLLKKAFHLRMSRHTIEDLEAMALEARPLDLDLEEDRLRELRGSDIMSALLRRTNEPIRKTEVRNCFLARFREVGGVEFLRSGRDGEFYERAEMVGGWNLMARLEFGSEPLNQFFCSFRLEHGQLEERFRFSAGRLLGLGDIRWNDIERESLVEDAQKAVQLWDAMRRILMEIIKAADSSSEEIG